MTTRLILPFLLCAACTPTPGIRPFPGTTSLAITGVNVVDVERGVVLPQQTVVMTGSRISAVGPGARVGVPAGTRVVDAPGKYLIPGLWDMHVHSAGSVRWHFPLFLAWGVTGVRNMHTTADTALGLTNAIKRRVASGELLGPRFIANGPIIDGNPPAWPGSAVVRDAVEAQAVVDSLADGSADFIKVYDRLSRESYLAAGERARRRGIPLVGHVPVAAHASDVVRAGQRGVEHLAGMEFICSSRGDSLRLRYPEVVRQGGDSAGPAVGAMMEAAAAAWDEPRCRQAIRMLRRAEVWVTPTLVAYRRTAAAAGAILTDSIALRGVPSRVVTSFQRALTGITIQYTEAPSFIPAYERTARMSVAAGLPLLAGTDVGNPLLVPGHSLHQELQEMVERLGLSPIQALRAATLNPARFLGATDSLGTVATGKLADLVLLDENPLVDIQNTRTVRAVVANGRYLDRAALDSLLVVAERAANAPVRSPSAAGAPAGPEAELIALEHAWARAIVGRDSLALERLMAPEFTLVFADAPSEPPLPRIPWLRNTFDQSHESQVELRDLQVQVYGDSAEVRLHLSWRVIGQGGRELFHNFYRLADTWVRRDGRWQVARRTRLGPAPPW